eukprot:2740364-Alexandrium_andersonii.AAC.1
MLLTLFLQPPLHSPSHRVRGQCVQRVRGHNVWKVWQPPFGDERGTAWRGGSDRRTARSAASVPGEG